MGDPTHTQMQLADWRGDKRKVSIPICVHTQMEGKWTIQLSWSDCQGIIIQKMLGVCSIDLGSVFTCLLPWQRGYMRLIPHCEHKPTTVRPTAINRVDTVKQTAESTTANSQYCVPLHYCCVLQVLDVRLSPISQCTNYTMSQHLLACSTKTQFHGLHSNMTCYTVQ